MGENGNPIAARSKRLITEALLELMTTVPFAKISIRDIVEKAGLTRQTFYHNFSSKEDVLLHKSDELFKGFYSFLLENEISDLETCVCFYFRYWQRNVDFLKLLMENNMLSIVSQRYPDYFRTSQFLYMGDKELSDVEKEYVYGFFSGALINVLVVWVQTGQIMTPREMATLVMNMLRGAYCDLDIGSDIRKSRMQNTVFAKTAEIQHS